MTATPKKLSKRARKHKHSHSREVALQALYQIEIAAQPVATASAFGWLNEPLPEESAIFGKALISGSMDHYEALDAVIRSLSDKDFTQISTINRCILRMGIFEIMRGELEPRIIIDDLLNLTRVYDGEDSVPFINGVLDRFLRERGSIA